MGRFRSKSRRLLCLLIAVLMPLTACGRSSETKSRDAAEPAAVSVTEVEGAAEYQHGRDGELRTLSAGQSLAESDIVITQADALVVIELEEGKEVHIGENTVFALSAIRRDATGNVNILALKQGSIVNVVDSALEEGDVYEVHTPRLLMSVRGTSNYMRSDNDGDEIIGITGQTHAFFNDGSAYNIVQGMKLEQTGKTPPRTLPAKSGDLPPLASSFAGQRGIAFNRLTREQIGNAQNGASDFRPSSGDYGNFASELFSDPGITAPAQPDPPTPPEIKTDSAPQAVPQPAVTEQQAPTPAPAPPVQQQAAQPQPEPQPARQEQPAPQKQQTTAAQTAAPTTTTTDSGNNSSTISNRRRNNSSSNTSVANSKLLIRFVDVSDPAGFKTIGQQEINKNGLQNGELSATDIMLPQGYYFNTHHSDGSIVASSDGSNIGNSFPITLDNSKTEYTVYVFECEDPDNIPVYIHPNGTNIYLDSGLRYSLNGTSLYFDSGYKLAATTLKADCGYLKSGLFDISTSHAIVRADTASGAIFEPAISNSDGLYMFFDVNLTGSGIQIHFYDESGQYVTDLYGDSFLDKLFEGSAAAKEYVQDLLDQQYPLAQYAIEGDITPASLHMPSDGGDLYLKVVVKVGNAAANMRILTAAVLAEESADPQEYPVCVPPTPDSDPPEDAMPPDEDEGEPVDAAESEDTDPPDEGGNPDDIPVDSPGE